MNVPLRRSVPGFRFRAFLFPAFVYLIAWYPILGLFDIGGTAVKTAVGAICLGLVGTGVWLQPKFSRSTHVLTVPYWTVLLACHTLLLPMAFSMDPAYFVVSVVLAAPAFFERLVPGRRPTVVVAACAIMTVVVATDLRFYSKPAAVMCFALGGISALAIRRLSECTSYRRVSQAAIAMAALSILVYPRSFLLYRLPFPEQLSAILSQPGVRAVYSYKDPGPAGSLPWQVMFLARVPGSETYLVGPQKPYHCLYLLRKDGTPKIAPIELGARGTDNPYFDPDDPRRGYIGAGTWFHLLSLDPPGIIASLHLKDAVQNLSYIRYDAKADRFLIAQDIGDRVFAVDRKTLQVVASIPCTARSLVNDVWIDPVGDLVIVNGRYFYLLGRRLDIYDRATLQAQGTYAQPWDYGFNDGALDPEERRAYLASTITGKVRVLDIDSWTVVDEFRLGVGIRNVTLDTRRRWLLVSGYFKGELFVYDVRNERLLGAVFLGKRLRWVHIDAENGKWYAATSAGGFEISPEEAFYR